MSVTPPLSSYPTYPISFTRPTISGTFGDLNYCPPVNNLQVIHPDTCAALRVAGLALLATGPPADNRLREYQLSVQTPCAAAMSPKR